MKLKTLVTATLACLAAGTAVANEKIELANQDRAQLTANKFAMKSNLGFHLQQTMVQHGMRETRKGGFAAGPDANGPLQAWAPQTGDYVTIDVVANGSAGALLAELTAAGLVRGASYGKMVSGYFPVSALGQLENMSNVRYARQSLNTANVGLVTSRGDAAMGSDIAKNLTGLTGDGIRIGVISDSYNTRIGAATTAEDDIASNDLPADIIVLEDSFGPASDEGRGMMQLIHDVAPGTSQAFHTALGGQANFASGIEELASEAGSEVIVDDIIYFFEPMLQDGIIAQAVDNVTADGVAYFSSAGNNGRDSWETSRKGFEDAGTTGLFGGARHDFDNSTREVDDLQNFVIGPFENLILILNWADPYFSATGGGGAVSDLDMLLYFPDGTFTGIASAAFNIGGDPIEGFSITNNGPEPLELALGIELFEGPEPLYMKYVAFAGNGFQVLDGATNTGTVYGHANAKGAIATGASAWFNTPVWNPNVSSALINSFSSAGPVLVLFDENDNLQYGLRRRPDFTGPDGGNTTFFGNDLSFPVPGTTEPDGFPNFFGTSASAPHSAAVAALMLEQNPSLNPGDIRKLMKDTAADMDDPSTAGFDTGFDFGTGSGFLQADLAIYATEQNLNGSYRACADGSNADITLEELETGLNAGTTSLGYCQ